MLPFHTSHVRQVHYVLQVETSGYFAQVISGILLYYWQNGPENSFLLKS